MTKESVRLSHFTVSLTVLRLLLLLQAIMSVCLSVCLSVLSVCLSGCKDSFTTMQYARVVLLQKRRLSVHPSVRPPVCTGGYSSVVLVMINLFVCLCVCLSVLAVCLFVCKYSFTTMPYARVVLLQKRRLSVRPSVCTDGYPSVVLVTINMFVCLSVCPSCPSVCSSVNSFTTMPYARVVLL